MDILNLLMRDDASDRLKYQPPVINLIPMGTGNALAHSSGITKDKTWGLRSLLCGSPKPVPMFKAEFSEGARLLSDEGRKENIIHLGQRGRPIIYGAVVCSWALHASLVAESDTREYRRFGVERFQMAAKDLLYPSDKSGPHSYRGILDLSLPKSASTTISKRVEGEEFGYLLATFCSQLDPTFKVSPKSMPLDGALRIVHFVHKDADEVIRLIAGSTGILVDDDCVAYHEIDGFRLRFNEVEERWRRVCVDGKIVRIEKDGEVLLSKESKEVLQLRIMKDGRFATK